MKKTLSLLILLPFMAASQLNQQIFRKALSNIAICKTEFKKADGSLFTVATCGIILNGTYFLTCYHDLFFAEATINNRTIVYNYKNNNGTLSFDTIHPLTSFKAHSNQYDFSNHRYDLKDHATDVYILKLPKKVNVTKHDFAAEGINQADTIYSYGSQFDKKANLLNIKYGAGFMVFHHTEMINSTITFIVSIGNIKEGFSGAPIYNSKGKILAMTLFGWNDKPTDMIEDYPRKKIFNQDSYNKINAGYKDGGNLSAAIDIQYIIKKYLKGYL